MGGVVSDLGIGAGDEGMGRGPKGYLTRYLMMS